MGQRCYNGTKQWDKVSMTYYLKYPHLGDTVRVRIPRDCKSHIELLFEEYERIAEKHGRAYLEQIQDRIEKGLNNVP